MEGVRLLLKDRQWKRNVAGQAIISFDGTNSVARFDTNGDGAADMAIVALGVQLEAGDFIV